jgi:hypothetical protein
MHDLVLVPELHGSVEDIRKLIHSIKQTHEAHFSAGEARDTGGCLYQMVVAQPAGGEKVRRSCAWAGSGQQLGHGGHRALRCERALLRLRKVAEAEIIQNFERHQALGRAESLEGYSFLGR